MNIIQAIQNMSST